MSRIVVTGGCGFIGSHVVDELIRHSHEIVVIDNLSTGRLDNIKHVADKVRFVHADIATPGSWQNQFSGASGVLHLAALADIVPSIQRPEDYFSSNVVGTFNVLEAAKNASIKKLVYAASSSCYGIPDVFPTPESAEIRPQYPYALTKRLGEELVMHWSLVYKIPAISLRFFNVYGPRSRTSGTYGAVFGVFLAQKLANKPFTIVGDGEQTRDFTFVTDVANAVVTAMQSSVSGKIYNVGSGATVSVNRIAQLLGGDSVHIPKRPGEPDQTFADIRRIREDLGWSPKVRIEQGVEQVLQQIDYWKSAPVWDPDSIAKATKEWFQLLS